MRFLYRSFALVLLVSLCAALALPVLAQETGGIIVHASRVNLRSGPGLGFAPIGQLVRGQQVTIIGGSGEWVQVRVTGNVTGWVNGRYVAAYTPPSTAQPGTFNGIVNAVELNVRSASSAFAGVIGQLRSGTAVNVVARSADNAWLQIDVPGGIKGWVNTPFINLSVLVNSLPVSNATFNPPTPAPPPVVTNVAVGLVSAVALNVRSGPGTLYPEIGRLVSGQSINLTGRSGDNQWLLVQMGNGMVGWVSARYITTSFPLGNLPVRG